MTVSSSTSRISYNGNGSTTAFAVPFYFLTNADLVVIKVAATGLQTTLALTTDYTVAGAADPAGGTVTCVTAPASGESLVIYRDPAVTQTTDYQPNDAFPAQTHERALDKLTMISQRIKDLATRSFRLSDGDVSGASTTLPTPEAGKLVGWNTSASGLANYDATDFATLVAYGTAKADTFTGDGATLAFALTSTPGAQANLDVSIDGVTQVPTTDYVWVSGTTLTFTTAPANGSVILARYMQALPQGTMDAAATTFLQSGTGAVERSVQSKLREAKSAGDFNAAADGSTNDTTKLQAALDASSGDLELKPNATYIISAPLSLTSKSGFKLRGNGATIKAQNGMTVGSGTQLLVLTDCSDFEIENLTLDGNRDTRTPAETTSHLLQITNCREFTLRNVEARNATTDGFYLNASNNAVSSTFTRDFVMENCRSTNAYRNCASFINTYNGVVIGGYFTAATGTAPQAGIDVESNAGAATPSNRSLRFIGVKFTGNAGYGLQLSSEGSPEDVSVESCYFADNTGGGILTGIPVRIIGGQMESMSAKGIDVQSVATARATVIGMEFRNFTTAACVDDGSLSAGIALLGCKFRSVAIAATPSGARFTATDCEVDTCTGIAFSLSTAATRASMVGNYIKGATGRAIYSVATDSEFINNRAVDVGTVSGGYFQITGARCVVMGNTAQATSAATTTIGFYVHHDLTAIAFNRCVNLHSTDPYSVQGTQSATSAFVGFNAGGTANDAKKLKFPSAPPTHTNSSRPTASVVPVGAFIWNSDDNAPNWSDGSNWRDSAGTIT